MNQIKMNRNYMFFNRIFTYFFVFTMFLSTIVPTSIEVQAASGDGTAEAPFLIRTSNDLYRIHEKPEAHYKLMNDIDLEGTKQTPMEEFRGVLDGNGFIIRNILINGFDWEFTGLFSKVTNAVIENLILEDIHVNVGGTLGILAGCIEESTLNNIIIKNCTIKINVDYSYMGSVTGQLEKSKIDNIHIENVDVIAQENYGNACGGAIGISNDSIINNSTVKNSNVSGYYDVGGFVGSVRNNEISNTYVSDTEVIGSVSSVGGFCGSSSECNYVNCYTTDGTVQGNENTGGFCGSNYISKYNNCYTIEGEVQGNCSIGGFSGYLSGSALINCGSTANVTAINDFVGGIAGKDYLSNLEQCFAIGNLKGSTNVGGILGSTSNYKNNISTINNSYAECDIVCTDLQNGIAGGLVAGEASVNIKNSYSASRLSASNKYGIGPQSYYYNTFNTFFDEVRAEVSTPDIFARQTSVMYTKMNYIAWNFDNIWTLEEGVGYPQLQSAIEILEPDDPSGIKLDIYLEVNEELQLSVNNSLNRNRELVWTSSDSSIVSVSSNGEIKALKNGDVVITATNDTYKETITVFVVEDSAELRLAADVNMGKSFRVKIRGVNNPSTISYTSSAPASAVVNTEGRVTGLSSGLALITAKDTYGNELSHIYVRVR